MDTVEGLKREAPAIIGTSAAFILITTATTAMRFTAKGLVASAMVIEDWVILFTQLMYLTTAILVILSDLVGRTARSIDDPALAKYDLYVYVYSIFYFWTVALCTTSVLFLYRRLFPTLFMHRSTLILQAIVLCWLIPSTIIEVGTWELPTKAPFPLPNWNIVYNDFWLASGIIEIFYTVATILLPIRQVQMLYLGKKRKLGLSLLFAAGSLCVITGIIRLASLYHPTSFDLSLGDIWLVTHCGMAVVSANLPVCWPLVSHRGQLSSSIRNLCTGRWSNLSKLSRKSSIGGSTLADYPLTTKDPRFVAAVNRRFQPKPSHMGGDGVNDTDFGTSSAAWHSTNGRRNDTSSEHLQGFEDADRIEVTRTVEVSTQAGY